jgi:hypothetical protein
VGIGGVLGRKAFCPECKYTSDATSSALGKEDVKIRDFGED